MKKDLVYRGGELDSGAMPLASNDTPEQPEALFIDERRLSREQAFGRYLTPADSYEGTQIEEKLMSLSGNGEYASLAPTSPTIMPQIRGFYDGNHIERIGRSMRDSPGHQLQNCGAAFIDDAYLPTYLDSMNAYFGVSFAPEDFQKHPQFNAYIFTVYGHNRQLGAAAANKETSGHPDIGIAVLYRIVRNPLFSVVIGMQATENTGQSPNMTDRAWSIVNYKQFRKQEGNPVTQEQVAKLFSVDIAQVSRAERYIALPADIKKLVEEEVLPYTGAIELDRLSGLYHEEEIVALAHRLASRRASSVQVIEEVKKREVASSLPIEIRAMVDGESISLPQARELARLQAVSYPLTDITEIASWIVVTRPPIDVVKKYISDRAARYLEYGRTSLWDEGLLDAVEHRRLIEEDRASHTNALFRTSIAELNNLLVGLHNYLGSGLAGDAVDKRPLATGMSYRTTQILEGIIASIEAESGVSITDTKDLVEALKKKSLGLSPDVVKSVDGVVQAILGTLELEASTSGEGQAVWRQEAVAKILELTKAVDTQPALF